MESKPVMILFIMLFVGLRCSSSVSATIEDDEKECAEQLSNLAGCIPFVSGSAKQPTKECCDDTHKVRTAKPKCLCVLIKESTDPSMGLPINTTLALQMPAACNINAKVSDCPSLLNLPADSPDAKIFKVAANADSSTASPSDSPMTSSSSESTKATTTASSTTSNGARVAGSIILQPVIGLGLASISFTLL